MVQVVERRTELFETVLEKIVEQLDYKTLSKLKREVECMLEEYDLSHYDVDASFNIELQRYEYTITRTEPLACLRFVELDDLDLDVVRDSLTEIHNADTRLFYSLVRKVFRLSQQKLLLFEFYDLTLLYASYQTDKYTRAYVLSHVYFREVDDAIENYFNATYDDVQYVFLKLNTVLKYVDEILLQQVDLALEQDNYSKAFVPLVKALCINKGLFTIKRYQRDQIEFVRRLTL